MADFSRSIISKCVNYKIDDIVESIRALLREIIVAMVTSHIHDGYTEKIELTNIAPPPPQPPPPIM